MSSGCPFVCACVSGRRRSPTGLPSTSSSLLLKHEPQQSAKGYCMHSQQICENLAGHSVRGSRGPDPFIAC